MPANHGLTQHVNDPWAPDSEAGRLPDQELRDVSCQVQRRSFTAIAVRAIAALSVVFASTYVSQRGLEAHSRRLQSDIDSAELVVRASRCRVARKPKAYGPIFSLEPVDIEFCAEVLSERLLGRNVQIATINFVAINPAYEVITIVEKGGPVYQVSVFSDSDRARWDIMIPPVQAFKGQSCLDFEMFCDVASVMPMKQSFTVVDRHRIQEFNFSWEPGEPALTATLGKMNMDAPALGISEMNFPSYMAAFIPYNSTHFRPDMRITPLHKDGGNRYFFISDTGNHRLMFLDATSHTSMDYMESFGTYGQARSDEEGFDTPMGIAVMNPTYESIFDSTLASVFVADRGNNRLVKLILGYRTDPLIDTKQKPTLMYDSEYYRHPNGVRYEEGLQEPIGVSVYRHYIFVAEATGNAFTCLTPDYVDHSVLMFVTVLRPARGIQISGSFAATHMGYLWFTYTQLPSSYGVGSLYLPEPLVQSPEPAWIDDFRTECTNQTIYHFFLMSNDTLYNEHVQYVLSAARINWRFPWLPDYLDPQSFNLTTAFDLWLWNETVLAGQMEFCQPPPPATTPPMLSANEEGWNTAGASVKAARAHARRSTAGPGLAAALCSLMFIALQLSW